MPSTGRPVTGQIPLAALLGLFAASGAAALVYEVLWLKELGRLFGVTAYAAATTLAVFFLGLALGGWAWGRRAERIEQPLKTYAVLEAGIALWALVYLLLLDLYRELQAPIFGAIGYRPALLLAVKFLLACGILLVPSFLMGGTLPVMAQYLVRRRSQLGTRATLLYAMNTIGAAVGALSAGFVLPRLLGFRGSYVVAIALNLVVALIAWRWRARVPAEEDPVRAGSPVAAPRGAAAEGAADGSERSPAGVIAGVAAFSGLATLGLEVIWTRMFSQVLQNSVYTFSIILGVFLCCLALGSGLAHLLCRRARSMRLTLGLLLGGAGLLVGLTPLVFSGLSGSLDYMRSGLGFGPYVGLVFAGTFATIGPAVLVMGAVFPYLMKLSEGRTRSAGRTVGQLVALNTVSAIAGSLLAGFLLLDRIGVWGSIRGIALLYFALALAVWPWRRRKQRALALLPAVGLLLIGALVRYGDYSRNWLDEEAGERLVEAWEGAAGSVAVVRTEDDNLRIRVNSSYNLGSSASALNERLQGQLPLVLHGEARSVFFLGLGTGITASGAIGFPVERIVACEINSDVIHGSRKYFAPWLRGLFDDPRVRIFPEDGRTWLAASREKFDVVVADIFLSFKSDVGSLYTVEHFRAVREHLEPGGIFVQWLPMFDLSVPEFEIMARTMREVFPSVTLWRRSFSPQFPVFALVGRLDDAALDPSLLERGIARLGEDPDLDSRMWLLNIPLAAYAGNSGALEGRLAAARINTDDRTILEYLAPVTERNSRGARRSPVLAWVQLLEYLEGLLAELPAEADPHLTRLAPPQRREVHAGLAQYGHVVYRMLEDPAQARRYREAYERWLAEPAGR
jgi:spermidine synthase